MSVPLVEWAVFFPQCLCLTPLSNIRWLCLCKFIYGAFVVFLWCPYLFLHQCHAVFACMALKYNLKTDFMISPTFFFLLKIALSIWSPLCFHIKYWIDFSWNFDRKWIFRLHVALRNWLLVKNKHQEIHFMVQLMLKQNPVWYGQLEGLGEDCWNLITQRWNSRTSFTDAREWLVYVMGNRCNITLGDSFNSKLREPRRIHQMTIFLETGKAYRILICIIE